MKLIIEKHPDFVRLSKYFKKIEGLAERMGIDVDELMVEYRRKESTHNAFRKSILSLNQSLNKKRVEIFQAQNPVYKNHAELSIIFNREDL